MSAVTQVRIESITPVRLVQLVREGRIRLPSFQRDYPEVFDALHGMQETARPGDLGAVADSVATAGFGRLKESDVLRTLLALRGANIFRDISGEFADDSERATALEDTEDVLFAVVGMLRDGLRIPHIRALPYPSIIPLLARLVHDFGIPEGRAAVLLRRWFWRGAAQGANPAGQPPQVRRALRQIAGAPDAATAMRTLIDDLPPAPLTWRPDLTQIRLNRALARVNLLGLLALEPRELSTVETAPDVTSPVISAADLLDTPANPLTPMVSGQQASMISGFVFHPRLRGGPVPALLAAGDEVRASHGVSAKCAELLDRGRTADALDERTRTLGASIKKLVDERAAWGAHNRRTAAELLGQEGLSA